MPLISALAFSLNSYGFAGAEGDVIEYLIVGGGGGSGYDAHGGGGAGGLRAGSGLEVIKGIAYTVSIGSGGTSPGPSAGLGGNGGGSFIQFGSAPDITHIGANGGGHGGALSGGGGAGGCGGAPGVLNGPTGGDPIGKSLTLTTANGHGENSIGDIVGENPFGRGSFSQGFDGGVRPGGTPGNASSSGGGGTSQSGRQGFHSGNPGPLGNKAGHGGNGLSTTISGITEFFGGGGGGSGDYGGEHGGAGGGGNGATSPSSPVASAGNANTGGGAGGGIGGGGNGNTGGSGIVIIKTKLTAASVSGSPTESTSGGFNIYKFTGTGSITF